MDITNEKWHARADKLHPDHILIMDQAGAISPTFCRGSQLAIRGNAPN